MTQNQEQTAERKVREFYDASGAAYEQFMGLTWHHGLPEVEAAGLDRLAAAEQLNKHFVAASGLHKGERALVFGSGVGGEVLTMAEASGAHFTGVTNNDYLTGRATKNAEEAGLDQLASFRTIGDTDYKDLARYGSFDAVFFYESVCHLPDKQEFFHSAYRALKPGRRLLGLDWLQRAFGEYQTEEQVEQVMEPVNRTFSIPWHGSVQSYRTMMENAGFVIETARDLYPRAKCFDGAPEDEKPLWLSHGDQADDPIREQKRALDAARVAGVFTVGMFIGFKDGDEQK